MSQHTRKRLRWLVGVAMLLVPANIAMVTLLTAGDTSTPAHWAEQMTSEQRSKAAARISEYPVAYRLELLKALNPAIEQAHGELSSTDTSRRIRHSPYLSERQSHRPASS